ncbi:hypothetical protein LguiB_011035 [Lonicera macranthoides]
MLEVVVLARLHGHRSPLPPVSRGSGKEKGSPKTSKKPMFSLSISREEIEVDIFSMTGSRMSRNPKKRPKAVQKQLDNLLPGMSLALVSPDACKVHDASQRQGEKSVQRYILGMLSSAADSNSWLANTGHLKPVLKRQQRWTSRDARHFVPVVRLNLELSMKELEDCRDCKA